MSSNENLRTRLISSPKSSIKYTESRDETELSDVMIPVQSNLLLTSFPQSESKKDQEYLDQGNNQRSSQKSRKSDKLDTFTNISHRLTKRKQLLNRWFVDPDC